MILRRERACWLAVALWLVVGGGAHGSGAKLPPGVWSAEQAAALEEQLDRFFASDDEAARKALFEQELLPASVGLMLEELEQMRTRREPEEGKKHGRVWRIGIPWMKDSARGEFNLSLPRGYTPGKAWGLVVGLHGSGGDVDNMVPFYTPQLNNHGFIVIYPQTTERGHYWGQKQEIANIDRLIEWTARRYRVDFRRVVVTGGSMGGMGTWRLLADSPQVWSCGASIAGSPGLFKREQMERLRGIPFYILHGDADKSIPVASVRRGVEMLEQLKIDHVYVEAPGAGHTPPMKYWKDVNDWIAKQPAKAWSPRPLYLPGGDGQPLWQARQDPLGLVREDDAILQAIRDGDRAEALKQIGRALSRANETGDRARLVVLRGVAVVPGLLDPFDFELKASSFSDARGWAAANEAAALRAFSQALALDHGKGPLPDAFDAEVNLLCAKIWARRVAGALPDGSPRVWVTAYNRYAHHVNAAQNLAGGHPEVQRLIRAVSSKVPKGGTTIIQVR